jgi:hypothetical protein
MVLDPQRPMYYRLPEPCTRGGNSHRVFKLFIMISNAYETFKFFYYVIFNDTFKKNLLMMLDHCTCMYLKGPS